MSNRQHQREVVELLANADRLGLSRRQLLALVAGAGGIAALGRTARGLAAPLQSQLFAAESATPSGTLVVAAPATPSSLDSEFNVDIQTTDAVGMLYDSLVKFRAIPDPDNSNVRREDLAFHKNEKYGWALEGKLAESWHLEKNGRKAVFQLRKGVKSNWGNELTAKDVKYTWDRHFALKGVGGFFIGVLKLPNPNSVKVEGPYTVSFETPKPNPVMLTMMVNLYNPIFDSTKMLEVEKSGDKWGQNFLKNNHAGFGPYELTQLTHGVQAQIAQQSLSGASQALVGQVHAAGECH